MRLNWNASRKNGRRGRRMEKHITMSGRDKVTVDFQAKDLNLVYFFGQCKSTFKWMTSSARAVHAADTAAQPQTGWQQGA